MVVGLLRMSSGEDSMKLARLRVTVSVATALVLGLGLLAFSLAATPTLSASDLTLTDGESGTTVIQIDTAPFGLSGYDISIGINNSIARITSVTVLAEGLQIVDNQTLSARVRFADIHRAVEPGQVAVTLFEVEFLGLEEGTATIEIEANRMDDDLGNPISINVNSGRLEITHLWVTLPGQSNSVQDLDGDRRAEDLNGNGRFDFNDIILLFQHLSSAEVLSHPQDFDHDGDGGVTFNDVVSLFNKLIGI